MPTFADAIREKIAPDATVVLAPAHFAPDKRSDGEVALGVRLLAHDEVLMATASANAFVKAEGFTGDEATERHNEELMLWAVGLATCDPNDATRRYFALGETTARTTLTPDGVRAIWNALEAATVAASPLVPLATDDDLADLGERLLQVDALEGLSPAETVCFRRWATVILQTLRTLDPSDD